MGSVEVFCRNVKILMTQRNIRIKDLADSVGLSESYLSLVLSGTKKNLGDEYKDHIASSLNVSVSQLYSEDFPPVHLKDTPIFPEDPERRETARLVDAFLSKANLETIRSPFYAALAGLSDREAQTLRSFLSSLLQELSRSENGSKQGKVALSLTDDERRLLAICSMAGEGMRSEWVKAASDLDDVSFTKLTSSLQVKGLIEIVEDKDGTRFRVMCGSPPITSIFSSGRVKEIHLNIARAMETYTLESPFLERALAVHLIKAGRDKEGGEHLKKAARLLESQNLWEEGGQAWHHAAVTYGILDDVVEKCLCLAEAARCLCNAGKFMQANELGAYACRVLETLGLSKMVGNTCVLMGNALWKHDVEPAIEWYRRGLASTPKEVEVCGTLLINLASALLDAGKLNDAENSLREARRWVSGRNPEEVRSINVHISLNMGLIEYQRRNWKLSRAHFESCLQEGEATDRLDTVWHNLGMLMYRDDNVRLARDYLTRALELYRSRGYVAQRAYAAIELAKVELRAGNAEEADAWLRETVPLLEAKSLRERGWVSLIQACLARQARHLKEAAEYGRKAVDIFQREGDERDLACAALLLSSLFAEAGDIQQSKFMERRAFQIYEKRHWDIRELLRERSLLEPEVK